MKKRYRYFMGLENLKSAYENETGLKSEIPDLNCINCSSLLTVLAFDSMDEVGPFNEDGSVAGYCESCFVKEFDSIQEELAKESVLRYMN